MAKHNPCSAIIPLTGASICQNGFPQTATCWGINSEHVVPFCCQEDACAHHYERNGGKLNEGLIEHARKIAAEGADA